MNKKNNIWNIICLTGIPWMIIIAAACIWIRKLYYTYIQTRIPWNINSFEDISAFVFIGIGCGILIFLKNILLLNSGKRIGLFTWLTKYKYEPTGDSARKRKAQYPPIDNEYLSKKPNGLVLGYDKRSKSYVRLPLKPGNIQNALLIGAPGCGKSVLLETMLIRQLNHKRFKDFEGEPMTFYCIDIKPELAKRATIIKSALSHKKKPLAKVMNPMDRSTYGWDPYYNLSSVSSDDDVMAELDVIARALINEGKAEKNAFFYVSGRNILKAILFYTYKNGKSFMGGMDFLLSEDIASVIKKVLEKIDGKYEYAVVGKLLKPYAGKSGEAFEGIELAIRQSLECFTTQTIRFFLDGNPRKASPQDLEKKTSVFFSVPETKVDEYCTLLKLVTAQVTHHCIGRSPDSHMLTLVIDEAARIGSTVNWTSFLATSRSRQCATILAFQSISQMQTCWSREEAKSLIELCRVIAVLSCTDPDTASMLSSWAGTYKEAKESFSENSKKEGSTSISYEDKKILELSDVMTLQDKNEILLFIKGKYFRTDVSKARYFNIPELNELSKKIENFNNNMTKKGKR